MVTRSCCTGKTLHQLYTIVVSAEAAIGMVSQAARLVRVHSVMRVPVLIDENTASALRTICMPAAP